MKLRLLFIVVGVTLFNLNCSTSNQKKKPSNNTATQIVETTPTHDSIQISDKGLTGYYKGPEYNEEGDIAHQFSNKVAARVGIYLKERYLKKVYLKVDLEGVNIKTEGLDQEDSVYYAIQMPFKRVAKCEAFTGIEHCGSWNYQPRIILNKRFEDLRDRLEKNWSIGNSTHQFYTTEEGFQEYWIQFKHKDYQTDCVKQ